MNRLGEFGDNSERGRCRWCGRKLRAYRWPEHFPLDPNPRGDYGDGLFCGLRCGYRFAVQVARDGVTVRLKGSVANVTRVVLFFTVLCSMMACGQVDQVGGAGGAGGDVAADSGAGGAAGRAPDASAGGVFGAGGSVGGAAAGTAGDDGGRGGAAGVAGAAGGAGAAGAMGGASTAPACRGTFLGSNQLCPQIAGTAQQPGGWQCEVNCSSSAADNAGGCVANGVTYCVPSCSWCHP